MVAKAILVFSIETFVEIRVINLDYRDRPGNPETPRY